MLPELESVMGNRQHRRALLRVTHAQLVNEHCDEWVRGLPRHTVVLKTRPTI